MLNKSFAYFAFLYCMFMLLDVLSFNNISSTFKFLFMFSIFLYSQKNTQNSFIKAALGLTLISDFFLIFTKYHKTGILFFSAAIIMYIAVFIKNKNLIKYSVFAAFMSALPFIKYPLYLVSIFYGVLFYINLFLVYKNYFLIYPCLPFAFTLFAFCDIFVALYNLTSNEMFYYFIWLFYAPSQYIILRFSTKWSPENV